MHDAISYCAAHGKRLPRSWEWLYAAQGLDGRAYPWGAADDPTGFRRPNETTGVKYPGPEAVDAHAPQGDSPFGVSDLVGNVWQMTDQWYDAHTRSVMVRGGSNYRPSGSKWYFPQAKPLGQHEKYFLMDDEYERGALGFRCAMDAAAPDPTAKRTCAAAADSDAPPPLCVEVRPPWPHRPDGRRDRLGQVVGRRSDRRRAHRRQAYVNGAATLHRRVRDAPTAAGTIHVASASLTASSIYTGNPNWFPGGRTARPRRRALLFERHLRLRRQLRPQRHLWRRGGRRRRRRRRRLRDEGLLLYAGAWQAGGEPSRRRARAGVRASPRAWRRATPDLAAAYRVDLPSRKRRHPRCAGRCPAAQRATATAATSTSRQRSCSRPTSPTTGRRRATVAAGATLCA